VIVITKETEFLEKLSPAHFLFFCLYLLLWCIIICSFYFLLRIILYWSAISTIFFQFLRWFNYFESARH